MSEQYFEEIGCEEFYGEDFLQEYYESLDTDDLDWYNEYVATLRENKIFKE